MTTKQRFYFKPIAGGGGGIPPGYIDTNDPEALYNACVIEGGYIINPDLPTPPTYTIPPEETDEKIVMIVSSELDSAVSFTATITNSGQFKTQVYNMEGVLKSTVNTNNNATLNLSLNTSDGTLHPDGYYLFKVVVTATLGTNVITGFVIKSRSGYAVNGWPVKELHYYTPNLTTLNGVGASLLKLLKYVKFYTNCNAVTTMVNFLSNSSMLKEVILPPQMNALTSAVAAFSYCTSLRILQWPNSLPAITTLDSCFTYGGLKKCTPTENPLPASMPLLASLVSIFEANSTIEEIEIQNDLPSLTDMSRFAYNGISLQKLKFTGTVGEPTAGVNFDLLVVNAALLPEITFPPFFYCRGGGQINQMQNCSALKRVVLPQTISYYITSLSNFSIFGRFSNCVNLDEFTEITSGGNTVAAQLFLNNTRKLATFWQPKLILYSATMNSTSAAPSILSSFECNWAEIQNSNSLGGVINFYFQYCQFQTSEINRIFTALPTITVAGTIDFRNNPGYAACNKSIATAKGWTVS